MARQSYSVAFEPELMEKVDALAKKQGVTRSSLIRQWAIAAMDALEARAE